MQRMDELLKSFVEQGRMKIDGDYAPVMKSIDDTGYQFSAPAGNPTRDPSI